MSLSLALWWFVQPEVVVIKASLHAVPVDGGREAAIWTRDIVRDVVPIVLISRLFFVGLTFFIPWWRQIFQIAPLILTREYATGTPFDAWNRWDALWYDDLARLGYNLRGPNNYKNVAFFPLYPLLTRTLHDGMAIVAHSILGLAQADPFYPPYFLAGLLVSNACAIGALIFYYGLVRLDYGRAVARRAVVLLTLFPLSVFLFTAYSEGTFLLCAIAFFYALRLERWWQAGLWGLLAAATRPPGAVLLAPFLIAWVEAHPVVSGSLVSRSRLARRVVLSRLRGRLRRTPTTQPQPYVAENTMLLPFKPRTPQIHTLRSRTGVEAAPVPPTRSILFRPRDWPEGAWHAVQHAIPAIAIPLGLGLYMIFLLVVFGDPLWFSRAQQAWWRTFAPPWETLYISVAWPIGDMLHRSITYWDGSAWHDLLYEVIGLTLTWLAWKRVPRTQGIYLWLVWAVLLSSPAMLPDQHTGEPHRDVLMSLPRMLLMLFPLFTYLALQRKYYTRLTIIFAAGLVLYSCIFFTAGWIS